MRNNITIQVKGISLFNKSLEYIANTTLIIYIPPINQPTVAIKRNLKINFTFRVFDFQLKIEKY